MLFVLDAYNIIGKMRLRREADVRCAFLRFLLRHPISFSRKNRIVVVFDGHRNPDIISEFPYFEIVFSGEDTADRKIEAFLIRNRPSAGFVVSDDREVRFYARQAGVSFLSVSEFLSWQEQEEDKETEKEEIPAEDKREINEELYRLWLKDES